MNAVATLLYDPEYLPGALVLGHTLRKLVDHNTRLVVVIDKASFTQLHLQLLGELWDELIDSQVFQSQLHHKLLHDLQRPELGKTYTKIQLWSLPYDKVLYLDADTLPLVGDSSVTDLLKLDFPQGKILAAPDSGFPDIFNSGVFALRPNQADYLNLVSLAIAKNADVSFDGADQGLLNQYFNPDPDWVSQLLESDGPSEVSLAATVRTSNWLPIPFLYNTTPTAQYEYLPAFNYFGPDQDANAPGDMFGARLVPNKFTPGEEDQDEVLPAIGALSAYHSSAYSYFSGAKARSQVKLIHFIGPLKPWRGSDSGLFQRWWLAWYEYSHGRLLHDALYRQYFNISVSELQAPGSEQVAEAEYSDPVEPAPAPKYYQPADLCDPNNYQQFVTQSTNSALAWDAALEAPPFEQPEYSDFSHDMRSFSNLWDSEPVEQLPEHTTDAELVSELEVQLDTEDTAPPVREEVYEQDTSETLPESQVEYGYHREQRPERVFDEKSDYMPLHYLLQKAEPPSAANKELELIEDDFNDFHVEKEILEEVEVPDEVEQEIAKAFDTGVPKIFPWEFRENVPSERSWD